MSKKKSNYERSTKYERKVGYKEKSDELCPTKAEMKRINDYLRKHAPTLKKGTKKICQPIS